MNSKSFRKTVRGELEKLSREQMLGFAWRCALRALPYLGAEGNFAFWKKEERQEYIYAIFCALDISAANSFNDDADAYDSAVYAASYAANAAVVANYASYAVAVANYASYAVAVANYASYAVDVSYAADASYAAVAAATAARMDLESIILQDLKNIQKNEKQSISTEFYGEIWDNFQKALKDEDCEYWGNLYQKIFDNQFVLDREALKIRVNVPEEIRSRGAAAVAGYLQEMEEEGSTRLNEARIIILGDKGAGKTSIARRLINQNALMPEEKDSTAGVDTTVWKLKKEKINVHIWDFAGHTITHAVHQFFLSERSLYIIVYNSRTEERDRLDYWLNYMENYGGDSKAIILVNKRDEHSVNIPINSLKEKYPIVEYYAFSIGKDKEELVEFRNKIASYIENNSSWENQKIPLNYYQVKEDLEKLFDKKEKEKTQEYITKEEFENIARSHDVDDIDELLKNLHMLGISLWYQNMQKYNTLILNPEWISDGVYKTINWVNENKRHSLSLNDFKEVFNKDKSRFPEKMHKFLFDLMKDYKLAYETEKGDLIIPHLLKEDRPEELPDFPLGESLMLRYVADQPLPPNTISRFIVRHNEEIKDNLVWRYGVILEDKKGSLALVREEDRYISVSVKGNNQTEYISRLRETLNDIFNSYKSDKPKLEYRIKRYGEISDEIEKKKPLWLEDEEIFVLDKRGKSHYDYPTNQKIPMDSIVNIYKINAQNFISGGQGNTITQNNFNFNDCNIALQSNLNELAQLLIENNKKQEAKDFQNAAKELDQIKGNENKEEIKKKGVFNRIKRLVNEFTDENSNLHKVVKGVKNGVSIAQDIAKTYNAGAQWLGLPQVPKPFL
jgi:GTPase SAR1 family protein